VNGVIKYRPAIDGYEDLKLEENERNVEILYSLTKSYLYDSVEYEYKFNNGDWAIDKSPNKLTFYNLNPDHYVLEIRAKYKNKILARKKLSFTIYQPFYKSILFIPLFLSLLFLFFFL